MNDWTVVSTHATTTVNLIKVTCASSTTTAVPPTSLPPTTPSAVPTTSELSYTGVNFSGMMWLALVLLLGGTSIVAIGALWRPKSRRH